MSNQEDGNCFHLFFYEETVVASSDIPEIHILLSLLTLHTLHPLYNHKALVYECFKVYVPIIKMTFGFFFSVQRPAEGTKKMCSNIWSRPRYKSLLPFWSHFFSVTWKPDFHFKRWRPENQTWTVNSSLKNFKVRTSHNSNISHFTRRTESFSFSVFFFFFNATIKMSNWIFKDSFR